MLLELHSLNHAALVKSCLTSWSREELSRCSNRLEPGRKRNLILIRDMSEKFPLVTGCRPVLGPTQAPVRGVPDNVSPE